MDSRENQVISQLETYIAPHNLVNPFFLPRRTGLRKLMFEDSFGKLSSLERSKAMEARNQESLERIINIRDDWQQKIAESPEAAVLKKDVNLAKLKEGWNEIEKGGANEQKWVEEAIGITAAFFEDHQKKIDKNFERLYDNQLYYLTLMSLGKGKYDFGELLTVNRGVQLDTGEGKTFCSGLTALIKTLQGKTVHIIEQNYVSAQNHAAIMAPFFNKFLHLNTGVVTDVVGYVTPPSGPPEKKVRVREDGQIEEFYPSSLPSSINIVRKDGRIVAADQTGEEQLNYLWTGGQYRQIKGVEGRRKCWQQSIVYCDHQSVGGDKTRDKIAPESLLSGQPPPEKVVAIVQEADALTIDWAGSPFVIDGEPLKGEEAWKNIAFLMGADDPEQAEFIAYHVWDKVASQLGEIIARGKGKEGPFVVSASSNRTVFSEDVLEKARAAIVDSLLSQPELKKMAKIVDKNPEIVEAALEVFFGFVPRKNYIPDKEPVLTDQYGLPLDKRQLSSLHQVYLRLSNIWANNYYFKSPPSSENLQKVFLETYDSMEVSDKTLVRTLPALNFKQYEQLLLTSGSLIPSSKLLADIYGAEVLAVARHQPVKTEMPKNDCLHTVCLDGGVAEIDFVEEKKTAMTISKLIGQIQKDGRAGLIIMPNIESAYSLNKKLPFFFTEAAKKTDKDGVFVTKFRRPEQIKLITGQEEWEKRGSLEKIVADIKPGDIIITTHIAHRDIDPHISPKVIGNGGLETIVCSPANERGLWQALQRSIRFNAPGKRRLIITDKEVADLSYRYLFQKPSEGLIGFASRYAISKLTGKNQYQKNVERLKMTWQDANQGDIEAQKILFEEYLRSLRFGEFETRNALEYLMKRDERLDRWYKTFIEKLVTRPWWREHVDSLAVSEIKKGGVEIIDRNSRRFYWQTAYASQKEQLAWWSDFLSFIDTDFHIFMLRPETRQWLQSHPLEHVVTAWQREIEEKIIKMKFQQPPQEVFPQKKIIVPESIRNIKKKN